MPREKGTSGANRKAESTDAPVRGGLLRSSDEASVMLVKRREQAVAIWIGSTGHGRNPIVNGRWQPSCDGTSRMNREVHVRICERLGVKCPGPTRHFRLGRALEWFLPCRLGPESGRKIRAYLDGTLPIDGAALRMIQATA